MLEKIKNTAAFIRNKVQAEPELGIILGTGLGGLVSEIDISHILPYEEIPDFPLSTVEGHSGKLIFGNLSGKRVIAMQGRFHFYEGYSMQELTFPVRVMKFLGIKRLIVSNASGGVNPDFEIGDIMLINDHINMMPDNPLMGKNIMELGPRFPDMSETYDKGMLSLARTIGNELGIKLVEGVYAATSGPCFETPAEYTRFRNSGADTVGMSTVPEVIVARHMGIPVFAVSIITDLGVPGKIVEVSHEEVVKVASAAEKKMTQVIKILVERL
ncbi:MAG: purine-nucleoside phosphorylase [Bacteroidetes bacterium]|nr:purine-nucleoside phosphorylase [Bacteroidota bacterium]MBU1720554.1 purine-nucleoside phosphorylase [Bacteroidota bacterium]